VQGLAAETLKPTDPLATNAANTVIGSNLVSCRAAVEKARASGFHAELVTDCLTGEAREAGEYLAQYARERADLPRPFVLVFGGETTVTVTGSGSGGRNQELALAAAIGMTGMERCVIVTLATDGEDGPTDAAGAVVDGATLARAHRLGLDPESHLTNNDAYTFFKKTGDLLVLGPTGTNVNDISFIFGF
jgi:hydroxypyruvate reductase